jgi:superfamily I DNA/RNA helicase
MKASRGIRLTTDDKKWLDYINSNLSILSSHTFGEDETMAKANFVSNCVNLLNKCRVNLVKSGETRHIEELADFFGIDLLDDEVSVVSTCLASAYKVDSVIDFTDMITTSVFSCKRYIPKYDLIFVDEAQDLNKAEQELLLASLTPNGRFVAVGDPKQAINGFAGADCESFSNLTRIANNKCLPLSVCYRCGKAMIDLAQSIVPNIKAFDGACAGEVKHTTRFDGLKAGDMILCRKSAPLVGLCLKLIANGISANVKGRDICEGLKALVNKTKARTMSKLFEKLDHEIDLARRRAEKKGLNASDAPFVVSLQDKVDCIEVIAGTCNTVTEVLAKLDALFADNISGNVVTLSTIHKAKGLESDNVWIIIPNKLPLVYKDQKDWEYEQELNLKYVAVTRAKKVLTFVDLDEDHLATYQF